MSKRVRNSKSLALVLVCFGGFAAVAAWQGGSEKTGGGGKVIAPIASGPRWWKGNLHTHSLWSDGDDFPDMIADWYESQGYNFLTMSEHNVIADGERWIDVVADKSTRAAALKKYVDRFGPNWVETRTVMDKGKPKEQVRLKPIREYRAAVEKAGKFLMIPGEEITHKFAKKPVHINGINLREAITPINGAGVLETIQVNMRAVEEQKKKTTWPNFSILNHPNYQWGVTAEDMMTPELRFFEVYNGHPMVRNEGDPLHASTDRMWDVLLAMRLGRHRLPIVYGVATDDSHAYHVRSPEKSNPGRGWVMVKAPYLSPEAIVRAMTAGDYYASSGVLLDDVSLAKGTLNLKIAAQPGVTYKTTFFATDKGASLDSEPMLDKDGKPTEATRKYSDAVGRVAGESTSTEPSYTFTGKELYVRAKVVSSRPHPNPGAKGEFETAWTQPFVGEKE